MLSRHAIPIGANQQLALSTFAEWKGSQNQIENFCQFLKVEGKRKHTCNCCISDANCRASGEEFLSQFLGFVWVSYLHKQKIFFPTAKCVVKSLQYCKPHTLFLGYKMCLIVFFQQTCAITARSAAAIQFSWLWTSFVFLHYPFSCT